jgi:hypothetical protein
VSYIVLKIGPNTLALYGPFSYDKALAWANSMNEARGKSNWVASVQPLYPET